MTINIKRNVKKVILMIVAILTFMITMPYTTIKAAGATTKLDQYTGYSVNVRNPDGHYEWNANYQTILIDGEIGFCIQPGYILSEGSGFNPSSYADVHNMSTIAYEGWVRSNHTMEDYLATQFMIWEAAGGTITSTSFSAYTSYKSIIQNKINHHTDKPSFNDTKITLNVGESVTLTDTNGVFEQFSLASNGGMSVSKSGNSLTITGTIDAPENAKITYNKIPDDCTGTSIMYEKDDGSQKVAKFFVKDPLPTAINVKVQKYGSLKIAKQDDLGNMVAGTSFKLSKNADMSNPVGTYTTGSDGSVTVDQLLPATYYVQEVGVPAHLVLDSTIRSIEIKANETSNYTANNRWKKSYIQVVKKDVDTGKMVVKANTTFSVYKSDGTYVQDITTNNNGTAKTSALLYGDYYLLEKTAPEGYTQTSSKLVYTLSEDGKTYTQNISNKRVLGTINIKKEDSVTGNKPQGEATLKGAVYDLKARTAITDPADGSQKYAKDAVVATLTTDDNATASIDNLYLGKYYLKEKTPSKGYTLDPTEYDITLSYENQNVSVITKNLTVKEKVISQPFSLIKISDNGSGESDLLAGVEFTVKLKKDIDVAGSWEKAPVAKNAQGERASVLVTDKKGYAISDELPYGTYVVRETKVPNNHYKVPDFTVIIKEDSREPQPWRIFNDEKFKVVIAIMKLDADTGKPITLSGAEFKIKNLDKNEYVGYWEWNPLPHYVDSWTTGKDGVVMTGDILDPGNYQLEETKAPDGYLLNTVPVKFKISSDTAYETLPDGSTPVITIKMKDEKPSGRVRLLKYDKDTKEILSGVQYQLFAVQDVIDPMDGSVIYKAGDPVSKDISDNGLYMTDEKGEIYVDDLPLGMYAWQETRALDGYVKDDNTYTFTLDQKNDTQKIYVHKEELKNQQTKTHVRKMDKNGDMIKGAELQLLDRDGTIIEEWISGDTPHLIKGLLVDGTYILREKLAPDEYVQSKDVTFTVKNTTDIQEVKMYDKQVSALKLDQNNDFISGVRLQVVSRKTKNIVDQWTTDGKAHLVSGLQEGETYLLQEVNAAEGYVQAADVEFTVTNIKEQQEIKMIDKQVVVKKVDIANELLKGAKLQVIDLKGNIIDSWTSDENPHPVSGLKENTSYILQELEAPDGYVKANDIQFNVSGKKHDQIIEMMDKQVAVQKIDDDQQPLAGAKVQVVSTETKKIVDQWITDGNPHMVHGLQENKSYILQERKAPSGFETSEDVRFIVTGEKENQQITMTDKHRITKIRINKTDSVTGENILQKAFRFAVYKDETCTELIKEIEGDTAVGTVSFNLRYGSYWIKERKAPDGYWLSDHSIHLVINEDGVYVNDKKYEIKDGHVEFDFENQRIENIRTGDDHDMVSELSVSVMTFILFVIAIMYKRYRKEK